MLSFLDHKIIFGHNFTKKYSNRKQDIEYMQIGQHVGRLMYFLDNLEERENILTGDMLTRVIYYIDGYTII